MYVYLQKTEFAYKASDFPYFSSFGQNIKPDPIKFTVLSNFLLEIIKKSNI